MQYQYQAMTSSGAILNNVLDAGSQHEAADELRRKGLVVMRLEAAGGPVVGHTSGVARRGRVNTRDLLLFARQMKMLLEAGAALVPALQAIEQQTTKPTFCALVRSIREEVEGGGCLADALKKHPRTFKPVFIAMIAAGEASASLPQAFDRLCLLTNAQMQVRRAVVSAVTYPALLTMLCMGVVALMIGFVVPRFKMLFANLNSSLPLTTKVMFNIADFVRDAWPYLLAALAALIAGVVFSLRNKSARRRLDPILLRLPAFGKLIARLELARVLRVWAAMLRSNVPLLDAVRQSRAAVGNAVFADLMSELEQSVETGGRVGTALLKTGCVEPIVGAAIATGEENGRLAESVDFVSAWVDDENRQMIGTLTRVAEPLLLTVMGLLVGAIAMSLFLPLFDIAAGGH